MNPYVAFLALGNVAAFGFIDAGSSLIFLVPLAAVLLVSLWFSTALSTPSGTPAFNGFLLLWAVYLFASMSWSTWPQATFWLAIPVASIPLVCLAGTRLFRSDGVWNSVRLLAQVTALGFGGWLVLEFWTSGGRSTGPLLDPNAAAALVNLFLLPLIWAVIAPQAERRGRLWRFAVIAILGAALASTSSRGAIYALIGAVGLSAGILLTFRLKVNRSGLIGAVVAFGIGFSVLQLAPAPPVERNMTNLLDDSSASARMLIWGSTWQMYLEHPFLGSGFGTFAAMYPEHRSPLEYRTMGHFAHNDYLQFLAEGGVPLLAMLVIFGAAVIRWFGQVLGSPKGGKPADAYEGLGLAIGLAAMFAHATVNFVFYVAPLALWIGIYAARLRGLAQISSSPSPGTDPVCLPAKLRRPARIGIVATGSIAAILLAADIVGYYWLSRERLAPDDYAVSSPRFQVALALSYVNPVNIHARDYMIRAQTQMALDNAHDDFIGSFMADAALGDIAEVVKRQYASCAPRVLQASLLRAFPYIQKPGFTPESVYLETLKERPSCIEAALPLARLYREADKSELALSVLEAANEWLRLETLDMNWRLRMLEETADTYLAVDKPNQALYSALVVLNNDPGRARATEIRREAERILNQGER